ncbi:MAG: glycosyltransferase [Candidatus Limnocylindrales bacterium]
MLIIGINYRPELTAVGPYTAGLAEALARRGDRVTVLTGLPHYPAWRMARGTPRRLISSTDLDGVRILRAAHYVPARQSALRRGVYEATFLLNGAAALIRAGSLRGLDRPDAILGIVPSLSGGILARAVAGTLHVRYGLLFQDLMGRAAAQSGISGGSSVARATARLEAWAARSATAVGVVSEAFRPALIEMGVPADRTRSVPNWARLAEPVLSIGQTRRRFGWTDDRQVVLHAGNMGHKQGLEQVVDAARLAADRSEPIRFVLAGGGNQEAALRAMGADLPTLDFVGVQPDGVHASLLAAADVLLLSERPTQLDMSLPSKLTSYLAAGRPIVAAIPSGGASAKELERCGAGLVVEAGEPAAILAALGRLRSEPALAAKLGAVGPAYVAAHLSAGAGIARAIALVDEIAA